MRTSRKDRRSERVTAAHRLMLTVLGESGGEILKEIITTIEISQHGTRIKGRRTLQPNWRGNLIQLSSGRQTPFRVVWQVKSPSDPLYLEAGLEILATTSFWGRSFANPDADPEAPEIVIENVALSPQELLRELRKISPAPGSPRVLEAAWCGLVEQLEERKVFTRTELVASLRKLIQRELPAGEKGAAAH